MQIRPLMGQLPHCSPRSSICRMAEEPGQASELLLSECHHAHLPPQGHRLTSGEMTILLQKEGTKIQSLFLALKLSTLHLPVLVQEWIKSQINEHNAEPVVKCGHKLSCNLLLSKFCKRFKSIKTSLFLSNNQQKAFAVGSPIVTVTSRGISGRQHPSSDAQALPLGTNRKHLA